MTNQYIVQTWASKRYTDLLEAALANGECTHLDAAVAYATFSGVRVLEKLFQDRLGTGWNVLRKRWLVGIDWCRSDPPALSRLDALPTSSVRIPSGATLVVRHGCVPHVSYHPKLLMLRGKSSAAIICGFGNLSANGLTKGCEVGSVCLIKTASPTSHPQFANLQKWFRAAWNDADSYDALHANYKARCDALVKDKKPVPTEDDAKPPEEAGARRGLSEIQMRQLRTYDHLWIEAGSLGANLGPGIPGNQLDMTRLTRVFFGVPPEHVEPNTILDHVTLRWEGEVIPNRTVKFGDNGMDKLNVPPPGNRGALFYKNKTLLLTREPNGSYEFTVGGDAERAAWLRRSKRLNANYNVGQRLWGLF